MTTLSLTEDELQKIISALLFSSCVNVVYNNIEPSYCESLKDLAVSLKNEKPDIQLQQIQFIKEENYEDAWSNDVYETFKNNIEVTTFDTV